MRKFVYLILVIVSLATAAVGVVQWRDYVARHHDEQLYRSASDLLKNGHAAEAAAVIRTRLPGARTSDEATRQWRELQVAVSAHLHQVAQLLALDERYPETIARDEDASLLVARARLNSGHRAETHQLADLWLPKSKQPQMWFVLQADTLLAEKKPGAALTLLKSRTFDGPADCGRLSRLAILSSDDLKASWNYLSQASALDPRNADIRSFRAQVLERIGKVPLARVEYIAALQADPSNLTMRDQLAEFYRRCGSIDDALAVWTGDASKPVFDFMWVKTFFWSRVSQPVKMVAARQDELAPLVKMLAAVPEDRFWNAEDFARFADAKAYSHQRQETFWLSLLELLRTHQDKAAVETLRLNRFDANLAWEPDLEIALRRILSYRTDGVLNPRNQPVFTPVQPKEQLHPFFAQLDDLATAEREKHLAMPPDLDRLLRGDEGFAAAMLAAGWTEAALKLRTPDANVDDLPSWVGYGFAQALRLNRGDAPAIAYAEKQRSTPELTLLIGELQLDDKQTDEGTRRLAPLAALDSDVGFRAAWLLATSALRQHQPDDAVRIVQAQPRLASNTAGKELLARVAVAQNRLDDADKAYAAIAADSPEAKTYLARRAYARKDWTGARRYTEELMTMLPDQLQLRANLDLIAKAEHAGS